LGNTDYDVIFEALARFYLGLKRNKHLSYKVLTRGNQEGRKEKHLVSMARKGKKESIHKGLS